jgi:hypothetical protein
MNGDIPLNTLVSGVEAPTFEEAIQKMKALPSFKNAHIIKENEQEFVFGLLGPRSESMKLYDVGKLENKLLRII